MTFFSRLNFSLKLALYFSVEFDLATKYRFMAFYVCVLNSGQSSKATVYYEMVFLRAFIMHAKIKLELFWCKPSKHGKKGPNETPHGKVRMLLRHQTIGLNKADGCRAYK